MEKIGLFIIYILVLAFCIVSFVKNQENFLALIGVIVLSMFIPSMMVACGVV